MIDLKADARFWNRTARKYAADPIADIGGYKRTLEETRRLLRRGDSVLELGCGTGTTALRLAPAVERIVATDLSQEMIAIAREKLALDGMHNVSFEVGTIDDRRWGEAAFDAVLAFSVLHLVSPLPDVLRAIHRVLRPGGLFISKTPCLKLMHPVIRALMPAMRLVGGAPSTVRFFSDVELQEAFVAAGFEIVDHAWHATRGKDTRVFVVARKPVRDQSA